MRDLEAEVGEAFMKETMDAWSISRTLQALNETEAGNGLFAMSEVLRADLQRWHCEDDYHPDKYSIAALPLIEARNTLTETTIDYAEKLTDSTGEVANMLRRQVLGCLEEFKRLTDKVHKTLWPYYVFPAN